VIRSWKDRDAEALWAGELCRRFQAIQKQARIRLLYLHSAVQLKDLRLPGYRLEKLTGDRKGQYSIRINDQYRVCFEWQEGDAYNVEITDYH
jgi:proteic killer suppression protein